MLPLDVSRRRILRERKAQKGVQYWQHEKVVARLLIVPRVVSVLVFLLQPQGTLLLPHGGGISPAVDPDAPQGEGATYWGRTLPRGGHRGHSGEFVIAPWLVAERSDAVEQR